MFAAIYLNVSKLGCKLVAFVGKCKRNPWEHKHH